MVTGYETSGPFETFGPFTSHAAADVAATSLRHQGADVRVRSGRGIGTGGRAVFLDVRSTEPRDVLERRLRPLLEPPPRLTAPAATWQLAQALTVVALLATMVGYATQLT